MNLSHDKVAKMTEQELYDALKSSSTVTLILDEFDFLNLKPNDIKRILYKVVYYLKLNNNLENLDYLIKTELYRLLKEVASDEIFALNAMSEYVNNRFRNINDFTSAYLALKNFIYTYRFYLNSPDFIIKFLNSDNSFNQVIKFLVNSRISIIRELGLKNVFNDDFVVSIIELYCMSNNIDIDFLSNDKKQAQKEETKNTTVFAVKPYSEESIEYNSTDYDKMFLREYSKGTLLSKEDEIALMHKIKAGDKEAREIFIKSNLGLVKMIASNYVSKKLDFSDLVQEGILGLMTAIDRYNPDLGYKFSTYASWWIRQAIGRVLLDQDRTLGLSEDVQTKIRKLDQIENKLAIKFGRQPSIEEIAHEFGRDVKYVEKLLMLDNDAISLNTPIETDEGSDSEFGDFVADEQTEFVDKIIENEVSAQIIEILKKVLKDRELEAIMLRTGVYGRVWSFEELSKRYGVTRERARQIYHRGLTKIWKSNYRYELIKLSDNSQGYINKIAVRSNNKFASDISKKEPDYSLNNFAKMLELVQLLRLTAREEDIFFAIRGYNGKKLSFEEAEVKFGSTIQRIQEINEKVLSRIHCCPQREKFFELDESLREDVDKIKKINSVKKASSYKRKMTLYEVLSKYTKEEIDEILKSPELTDIDYDLIESKWGTNLDKEPDFTSSRYINNRVKQELIPKLVELLESKRRGRALVLKNS